MAEAAEAAKTASQPAATSSVAGQWRRAIFMSTRVCYI